VNEILIFYHIIAFLKYINSIYTSLVAVFWTTLKNRILILNCLNILDMGMIVVCKLLLYVKRII